MESFQIMTMENHGKPWKKTMVFHGKKTWFSMEKKPWFSMFVKWHHGKKPWKVSKS